MGAIPAPHPRSDRGRSAAAGSASPTLCSKRSALRVGEDVWRCGHLPRAFIEYRLRAAAPEAPHAELVLVFHPDGTVVFIWHLKAPLRHNATRLRRFEDLSPEVVAEEIDTFLAVAVTGYIGE